MNRYIISAFLVVIISLNIKAQSTTQSTCTGNSQANEECRIQSLQRKVESQEFLIQHLQSMHDVSTRKDCADLRRLGYSSSGVYDIFINYDNSKIISTKAFCDMTTDNGGWTVLQNRQDASVSFRRNWEEYKHGFGYLYENHWLGNLFAHTLTNSTTRRYKLRIDISDWEDNTRHAVYSGFKIASEEDKFQLHFDAYVDGESNAGDSLSTHNGMYFTTQDNDNDQLGGNCAQISAGGFWHEACQTAGLNNFYSSSSSGSGFNQYDKIRWDAWHGNAYSLKTTRMMIRPE